MSDGQRKRAFAIVVLTVAIAVALLLALGRGERADTPATSARGVDRQVVDPAGDAGRPTVSPAARRRRLQDARSLARRFAVAYLDRDDGTHDPETWRDLRATTTDALWQTLRAPVRIPPSTRPPRARFERVNGISETGWRGEVAATVEYRRARARRYLRVVLIDEAGAWRASRISP